MTITNKSSIDIEEAYLKVELYSKSDVLSITKYMDIKDLKIGESRNYKLNFEGKYIETYKVTAENEFPDKSYDRHTHDVRDKKDSSEYIYEAELLCQCNCQCQCDNISKEHKANGIFDRKPECSQILTSAAQDCFKICQPYKHRLLGNSVPFRQ